MRRLHAAIAVGGLGAGGLMGTPPASAAPCSGYTCHGHDPVSTGCNQYRSTFTETNGSLASVVNWYSTGCNANWADAWMSSAASSAGDKIEVLIGTLDSRGTSEEMCYAGPSNTGQIVEACNSEYPGSNLAYTDMVDGTNRATASVLVFDRNGTFITGYSAVQW